MDSQNGEADSKETDENALKEWERKLENEAIRLKRRESELRYQYKSNLEAIERIFAEKSQGFPWLAKAWKDWQETKDRTFASWLFHTKRPAKRASEYVRQANAERRDAEEKYRVAKHLLEYYETLFPWLLDFRGEDVDDLIVRTIAGNRRRTDSDDEDYDPAHEYLTDGEYESLSKAEKFQLALDRYWQRKKSPWQIGRDYERYIGYLYENDGYKVHYQGILEGYEDLGRDLIAKNEAETVIIQCKCWSEKKTIHEKHICQLLGTTVKYCVEHWKRMQTNSNKKNQLLYDLLQRRRILGEFVTSTSLSSTARDFADVLGIRVKEQFMLRPYPSIKCHVSRDTGEKIYHLPFDQQYDKTIIEQQEGTECYVKTVAEAEELGFRRAYRWRGSRD